MTGRKYFNLNYIHGEWECVLNNVEACAIHAWPVVSDHFPFIYCVESLTYTAKYDEWETCFEKLNRDPKPVTDCIASGYAHESNHSYQRRKAHSRRKGSAWGLGEKCTKSVGLRKKSANI
ncbi:putative gamma interferon inducible lysosomal thiol reductase GILT [Helianthus annuus]|nr:putative gamma interferon inducible lysosomal thiol reductase GILT [Helianthus annuus]